MCRIISLTSASPVFELLISVLKRTLSNKKSSQFFLQAHFIQLGGLYMQVGQELHSKCPRSFKSYPTPHKKTIWLNYNGVVLDPFQQKAEYIRILVPSESNEYLKCALLPRLLLSNFLFFAGWNRNGKNVASLHLAEQIRRNVFLLTTGVDESDVSFLLHCYFLAASSRTTLVGHCAGIVALLTLGTTFGSRSTVWHFQCLTTKKHTERTS